MKNISNYQAEKYNSSEYLKIEDGIYEYMDDGEKLYVTSLTFEQEPEYEEGEFADDISQYPLEDLLDKFYCHISDFYDDLNVSDSKICYLEFAAMDLEDIRNLREIIGKHVYNKEYEEDGNTYIKLIIEQINFRANLNADGLMYTDGILHKLLQKRGTSVQKRRQSNKNIKW